MSRSERQSGQVGTDSDLARTESSQLDKRRTRRSRQLRGSWNLSRRRDRQEKDVGVLIAKDDPGRKRLAPPSARGGGTHRCNWGGSGYSREGRIGRWCRFSALLLPTAYLPGMYLCLPRVPMASVGGAGRGDVVPRGYRQETRGLGLLGTSHVYCAYLPGWPRWRVIIRYLPPFLKAPQDL